MNGERLIVPQALHTYRSSSLTALSLQRVGLAPPLGPLFKAEHPELANLRWDVLEDELPDMFELRYLRDRCVCACVRCL